MLQKRNTRQEILNEAFLLCSKTVNSNFSLSELAKQVGISKTAIFRHFKNKDALLKEMADIFLTQFAQIFTQKEYFFSKSPVGLCTYDEFCDLIGNVVSFYLTHTGYLSFVLNCKSEGTAPGEFLFNGLKEKGVVFSDTFVQDKTAKRFFQLFFCCDSIVYFVSRRLCQVRDGDTELESQEVFIKSLCDLLWNGLGAAKIRIDAERLKTLDKLCQINVDTGSDDTRFFKAFAELSAEYGIDGITIERISEKLNLAKSSLYSFFDNKDSYIKKMMVSEMTLIMSTITEKIASVKTREELIYVLLRTESNYLAKRPFVLMIHYWASQNGFDNSVFVEDSKHCFENALAELNKKNFDFGPDMTAKTFFGWVSSMTGSLKIFFDDEKMKKLETNVDSAMALYELTKGGLSGER